MKRISTTLLLGAFFLVACDGNHRTVSKNSGPTTTTTSTTTTTDTTAATTDTAPNANATATQVMDEPAPAAVPVAAVESEQNRRAVTAAPAPRRSTASTASTTPTKMEEAPIDETWDQPSEPMYNDETFQQSQEDWATDYESKTYNELQLSDDKEDFPIEVSGRGETYDEWVNKNL